MKPDDETRKRILERFSVEFRYERPPGCVGKHWIYEIFREGTFFCYSGEVPRFDHKSEAEAAAWNRLRWEVTEEIGRKEKTERITASRLAERMGEAVAA